MSTTPKPDGPPMSEIKPLTRKDTERLLELAEKATPGPWVAIPIQMRWYGRKPLFPDGTWHILPEANLERVSIGTVDQGDDNHPPTREHAADEAAFIAESREAIPALIATIEAAIAYLHKVNTHGGMCPASADNRRECICSSVNATAFLRAYDGPEGTEG